MQDVVALIFNRFKELPQGEVQDVFAHLEAELSLNKLYKLLESFQDSKVEACYHVLRPLCNLLSQRWLEIKYTDVVYPLQPNSKVNQAYRIVAECITNITGISVYTLLMPTVTAHIFKTSRENIDCFKLHEFVLGEENLPIEVVQCLKNAETNKTSKLFHTTNPSRPLNFLEFELVIHHSEETERFYDAINCLVKLNLSKNLVHARENLESTYQQGCPEIKASYGITGKRKLVKMVLKNVKNVYEFINLMALHIEPTTWKHFLQSIETDELSEILLGGKEWCAALKDQTLYTTTGLYNNALLFCFIELYIREYAKTDFFCKTRSLFLRYSKRYLSTEVNIGGFTKAEKEMAAFILQNFLAENYPFSEINDYLANTDIAKYKGPLFQQISHLSMIYAQISTLSILQFNKLKNANYLYRRY